MPRAVDTVEESWTAETIDRLIGEALSAANALEEFSARFRSLLGNPAGALCFTASAREGLRRIFAQVAAAGRPRRVLLPAFNCPVVADSATLAGLAFDTYDSAAANGAIDWSRIAESIVGEIEYGVVVVSHLFGSPTDFTPLLPAARERGVFVVEDCAHTLGASIGGEVVGTMADAAVWSFNYDKPISLGWGGAALVLHGDLAGAIDAAPAPATLSQEQELLADFNAFLRDRRGAIVPRRWRQVDRVARRFRRQAGSHFPLPDLGIGPLRAALGSWQLERYAALRKVRNHNYATIASGLPSKSLWYVPASANPSWLRLKVGMPDQRSASTIGYRFRRQGIRAGVFNWPSIIESREPRPHAAQTARRFIDIPVHQNLTADHVERIHRALIVALLST